MVWVFDRCREGCGWYLVGFLYREHSKSSLVLPCQLLPSLISYDWTDLLSGSTTAGESTTGTAERGAHG